MKKHFTKAQLFGFGRALGLSPEDTKQTAYSLTGKSSLTKLTQGELDSVCWEFIARKDSSKRRPDRASDRQLYLIAQLEQSLGWANDPKRLQAFLAKYYHVQTASWLTPYKAAKVIESLKAMAAKQTLQ